MYDRITEKLKILADAAENYVSCFSGVGESAKKITSAKRLMLLDFDSGMLKRRILFGDGSVLSGLLAQQLVLFRQVG